MAEQNDLITRCSTLDVRCSAFCQFKDVILADDRRYRAIAGKIDYGDCIGALLAQTVLRPIGPQKGGER